MNKAKKISKIEGEILELKSILAKERRRDGTFPVIGEGSLDAKIMFVGEAPGKNEAATGKPFCGASGRILNELLEGIGLNREDVYVTNVVKDRPPKNRDPRPEEIEMYAPFLDRQIEIIKPKVIATLGRFSMKYLMERYGFENSSSPISDLHGKPLKNEKFVLIPLFHPAASIYNRKLIPDLKKDFKVLKKYI